MKLSSGVKIQRNEDTINEGLGAQMIHPEMKNVLKFEEAMKLMSSFSASGNKYAVVEAYTSMYHKVSSNRQQVILEVEKIRNAIYLPDVILDQFVEDALAPEISTGQIFNIEYKGDKTIDKILKDFESKSNLDAIVLEACPDLCAYGDYYFKLDIGKGENIEFVDQLSGVEKKAKIVKSPEGIKAIRDNVDQGTIVTLTDNGEIKGYLYSDDDGNIIKAGKESFWRLSVSSKRYRVGLEETLPFNYKKDGKLKAFIDTMPRYIRIGRSMIYPFVAKFKELDLLEKLVPATKLSKLSNVNLVGLNVPGSYDIEKGLIASKKVENIVNNRIGVDKKLNELTVESIIGTAGRIKVIPTFGDKGGLDKMDFQSSEPDEMLSSIEDLRRVICDSIGVPYEILYKSDSENKGELLRRYAKYLRKLKNFQRMLVDSIHELCCIHLKSLGKDFDPEMLNVECLNKLIEIDNIDRLEHSDITINNTSNMIEFFNNLSGEESPYSEVVNLEVVGAWINKQLKTIGLDGAIILESEGGKGKILKPADKAKQNDAESETSDDMDKDMDGDIDSDDLEAEIDSKIDSNDKDV